MRTSHNDSAWGQNIRMGGAIWVAAVLAVLLVVGGVVALRWYSADFRGELDARERTLADGGYRLSNYEWFYNQCHAVRTAEDRINTTEQELHDELNPPTEQRAAQLRINLGAQRNQRASLINNYNARASMEGSRGHFRDDNLPHQIDLNEQETSCEFIE